MNKLIVYKKSNGQFICGNDLNEITPAGTYRLTIKGNTLTFINVYTSKVTYVVNVTEIKKENGSYYTSLADFITGVGDFFLKPSANSGWQRHDDQQGIMTTVSGGSALGTINIRDTGCTMLAFQNANDDIAVQVYQFSHRKRLNTNADGVHLHYYLPSKPNAGQTIIFNYAWTWYNSGDVVPAIADWNTDQKIHTFTGNEAQYSTGVINIITNLQYPANEGYSSILRVKVTRDSTGVGSDTYNDDLGIDYFDVHYITDRQGSILEYTDE